MPEFDPVQAERARNLWNSFGRKFAPVDKATRLVRPETNFERIGGLAAPKDELLTFACAATSPEVYERWGTFPPSGLLLIGQRGSGKKLLGEALAWQTGTGFLLVQVPRLVMETLRHGGKVGDLTEQWSQTLEELPPVTVFFDELEFYQAHELGSQRDDLPIGPVMDFLLDMVARSGVPRAQFPRDDVLRLLRLAGEDGLVAPIPASDLPETICLSEDFVKAAARQATTRIEVAARAAALLAVTNFVAWHDAGYVMGGVSRDEALGALGTLVGVPADTLSASRRSSPSWV